MKRKITEKLRKWKDSPRRKPLIVRGARQVGKSYAISEFGESEFEQLLVVDFEKRPSLCEIFQGDLEVKSLLELLEIALKQRIVPGKTLLFFDEIQLCPRALMALRYFYEDKPELHVIAAGSLLEFKLEKISFPVGRVEFLFLYPLNFEEFLVNTGQELLLAKRPCLDDTKPLPEVLHQQFLKALKSYFIVGGMPEAVKTYVEEQSLIEVAGVHDQLIQAFTQDILKYEKHLDSEALQEIMASVPQAIGQPVKYTSLSTQLSLYKIKKILSILEKALLVHSIRSSSAQGLPLGSQLNKSILKLCFLDIGLMQHICGLAADDLLQAEDLLDTYQGALCEQFVGQELLAVGGSQNNKLYYWSRNVPGSLAEVDYLVVRDGKIYPIEVKKGPKGRLRSLDQFLKQHPQCDRGFVLNSGNLGQIEDFAFRPLYVSLGRK